MVPAVRPSPPPHPAEFPRPILSAIASALLQYQSGPVVLDPFAGTGGIHHLHRLTPGRYSTVGVEIEPEWAAASPGTIVGDATRLPIASSSIDTVATSPCYGNRMADHHEARDSSYRHTYRHLLGRPLSDGSAAGLHWGNPTYRELHRAAWSEVARVIRPGGLFVLNVKDHRRSGRRMHVASWHATTISSLGFRLVSVRSVRTSGFRFGANLSHPLPERVLVFVHVGTAWHWGRSASRPAVGSASRPAASPTANHVARASSDAWSPTCTTSPAYPGRGSSG